jgi:hypothetical protein
MIKTCHGFIGVQVYTQPIQPIVFCRIQGLVERKDGTLIWNNYCFWYINVLFFEDLPGFFPPPKENIYIYIGRIQKLPSGKLT